MAIAYLQ